MVTSISTDVLDRLNWWSNVGVLSLGVLVAICAILSFVSGNELSARKDTALEKYKAKSAIDVAQANTTSEGAKKDAAVALLDAAGANRGAEEAKLRALAVALDLEKQRARAAEAERSLLELKQRVAPRLLDSYTQSILLNALRSSSKKGHVTINAMGSDAEAGNLGIQLSGILKAAGWSSMVQSNIFTSGPPPIGITLYIHTSVRADTEYGIVLERELKRHTKLEFAAQNVPGDTDGSVVLVIGSKPNPPFDE